MSSETPQSPPIQSRTRHLSRFVEGPPATGAELLQQTTSNELRNILHEMDEFERKRKHRGSSSSIDSLVSPVASPVNVRRHSSEKEGRRSVGFGSPSRDVVREMMEEMKSHKIVGRLRAFTGGRQEGRLALTWGRESRG